MKITNRVERAKAQHIYDTYFASCAKHCIDFSFFSDLAFYGGITNPESLK